MELDLRKSESELIAQVGALGGLRKRRRGGVNGDGDAAMDAGPGSNAAAAGPGAPPPEPSAAVKDLVSKGASGSLTEPEAKAPSTAALVALESGAVTKTSDEAVKMGVKAAVIHLLKTAYDKGTAGIEMAKEAAKKAGQAGLYGGGAGAVLYVTDSAFRAGLCDPLAMTLSKSVSILPAAAAYAAQCDASLAAYNTAITAALVLVSPLVLKAINKAASIVVSEDTLDAITDRVIKLTTPGAAANVIKDAIDEREKSKQLTGTKRSAEPRLEDAPGPWGPPPPKRRGGKKTKKRVMRRRATRRRKGLIFSY